MGTRRVRALLDSDRRAANEVRPEPEDVRLVTAEYRAPLRVRLKQSFREDERVRLGSLVLSAGMMVALVVGVVSALGTARASHDQESAQVLTTSDALPMPGKTLALSHQPRATEEALEPTAPERHPVNDRLQRARRVLRWADAATAAKLRAQLEQLVQERPKDGRPYAALAEACLRLSDARCARDAVSKALARQPRRAKYRALAGRIERTFAAK